MSFSSFASIRESVKERMTESPLNRMDAPPPTFKKMETLVEQFAISAASVRIETGKTIVWASGDFGCPPLALKSADLNTATGGLIRTNARLDLLADVHVDIKYATTPTDLLCLNKK